MTRTHEFRDGARRARDARRERVAASPARLVVPLLLAVAVIGSAALVSAALGLAPAAVLAVTAAVAVTGAVIAHRTVRSLSAGIALLLIRPYAPGERVRLHSAEHGGLVEAEVVRIGLANTTLATDTGLLVVPNHRLLHGMQGT